MIRSFNNVWICSIKAITLVGCLCWFIWKARNEWGFEGNQPNSISVITKAVDLSLEVYSAYLSLLKSFKDVYLPGPSTPSWEVPCPSVVKINCDGA